MSERVTTDEGVAAERGPVRLGRVIVRLSRALERSLVDLDLTISQYRILAILDGRCEAASALAEKLSVSRPSVTGVIDGLEARGLVARCQDCCDRRRVEVRLTDAGEALLVRADAAAEARLERLAGYAGEAGPDALATLAIWDQALREARAARRPRVAEAAATPPGQSAIDEECGR